METESIAAQPRKSQLHSYLRQGIDKTFNLEAQSANTYFQKAVELDRENPTGYAFLALAHLFFYEMSFEPKDREKNQEAMLQYVSETMSKGENKIKKDSKDSQAYFAVGLAKIAKIRWAISQKKYVVIAQETSNVWDYLEKAQEEDPQMYDINFPMGLLH